VPAVSHRLGSGSAFLPPAHEDERIVPASRQDLFACLARLGILTETVEHEAVFTVEQSAKLERLLRGGHTKNLFLKDKKDRLFLVVALSTARIDLKGLHKLLHSDRLSFGRPGLLLEVLGVPAQRVTVILDADMMRHARLNYHPLANTATTNISGEDLIRFIRACGHTPRILAVAQPTSSLSSAP
jgi:Ala-tRNA(Pro) deacylase